MSDAFQMPKTVDMPRTNAAPPDLRDLRTAADYAPKRGLAAVAEAISSDPPPYKAPPPDYKPPKHQDAIKEAIKRLTHREMRELVAAIFAAHQKCGTDGSTEAITIIDLPDVLDKFAYGD